MSLLIVQEMAERLRKVMTPAEKRLWAVLKGRGLERYKVRRQFPVGRAILDFCIPEYRLGIELDGDIHLHQQEYDASRTEYLEARGYRIIRFANETIESDLPSVLAEIEKALNDLKNERNTSSD